MNSKRYLDSGSVVGFCLLVLGLVACPPAGPGPDGGLLAGPFSALVVVDSRTVILSFGRPLDPDSVVAGAFSAAAYDVVPPLQLPIVAATLSGDAEVTLETAPQIRGKTYTLRVERLSDTFGEELFGTINFVGAGPRQTATVTFTANDPELAALYVPLQALVSVDSNGLFSEQYRVVVVDSQSFSCSLEVVVNPNRTVARGDDGDLGVDRRGYSVRFETTSGTPASPLILFEVLETGSMAVEVPLQPLSMRCPEAPFAELAEPPPPVDGAPGDGVKLVRVIVDDRQARELSNPALSGTFDASGTFSLDETVVALVDPDGDRIYEAEFGLAVDPVRINTDLESAPLEELPYIVFLMNSGAKIGEFYTFIVAVDEAPENLVLPLGDPDKLPVTLRVDVGDSFVTADGSQRGPFANEAIFITGNFANIVDAFGQNCADSWSGGENLNLKMNQNQQHPGIWEKTLWMPPGRSQTWKVVRCDAEQGCGPLNARVSSSGHAFATVMKNLVTENLDAADNAAVQTIDPGTLESVFVGGQTLDYRNAHVYEGTGSGREEDPAGTPDPSLMFKQEMPNLVVSLLNNDDCPVQTPIHIIASWRDVNLPMRPAEMIESIEPGDTPFGLGAYDYDESMIGRRPPVREEP